MTETALQRLFALCDGYREAALVQFANGSGLLDDLRSPAPAADVAASRGWDERRTVVVLRALAAVGVCTVDADGRFALHPQLVPFLDRSSPRYQGDVLEHSRLQWELWSRIGEVMAATAPHPLQQEVRLRSDDHANSVFNRAMQQLAGGLIGDVVAHPIFEQARTVVDLAGGHGDYLAAVAASRPRLRGEVWDVAASKAFAEANFEERALADRLAFVPVELEGLAEPPTRGVDVVMVNDCLHYLSPEVATRTLRLACNALGPGGHVSVVSPWLEAAGTEPAGAALFSFYMMVNSFRGGVYPVDELLGMLRQVGFVDIDVRRVGELDDSAHIVAARP